MTLATVKSVTILETISIIKLKYWNFEMILLNKISNFLLCLGIIFLGIFGICIYSLNYVNTNIQNIFLIGGVCIFLCGWGLHLVCKKIVKPKNKSE